jgi:hypothetical protein
MSSVVVVVGATAPFRRGRGRAVSSGARRCSRRMRTTRLLCRPPVRTVTGKDGDCPSTALPIQHTTNQTNQANNIFQPEQMHELSWLRLRLSLTDCEGESGVRHALLNQRHHGWTSILRTANTHTNTHEHRDVRCGVSVCQMLVRSLLRSRSLTGWYFLLGGVSLSNACNETTWQLLSSPFLPQGPLPHHMTPPIRIRTHR